MINRLHGIFGGVLKKQKRGLFFFIFTEAILAFEQMKSGVSTAEITGAD